MASLPGLVDVKSSLQAGNPELQISYKRDQLATYGLSLRNVAELVRHKVQGKVATDFRQDERQIDVLVRLREEDRLGLDELQRLVINPNAPIPIPLSSVADIQVNEGPSEIRRIDQQRSAVVTANIQGIDLGTASGLIHDELSRMDFPMGFDFMISGQNEEMETSLQSLYFALVLAIFLVYVVMASQFESLVHPFVIMFTVPLALIGVVVALYLAQVALSVVVFIGLIMLAGIVVNNAIVLIDYINTLRRTGMEKTEAIIQAGAVRLRPIAMTTATTVLGLLPMALGLGEGAEIRTADGPDRDRRPHLFYLPHPRGDPDCVSLVDRRGLGGTDGKAKPVSPAALFSQPASDRSDVAGRAAGGGLHRLHAHPADAFPRRLRLSPTFRLASYPNAGAVEVEQKVVRHLEEAVAQVSRVKNIRSSAYSGGGNVRVEFQKGTDLQLAFAEMKDRLDRVMPELPDEIEQLWVRRWIKTTSRLWMVPSS